MMPWTEPFIVVAAFLLLLVYHVRLARKVRAEPLRTAIGITNQLRRDWVRTVMEEKRDILAVQTLRNWVMASSLLASSAILISLAVMGVAFSSGRFAELSGAVNLFGTKSQTLWLFKMMLLIVDFFYAFFNFTLAVRYYNHASFAINVSPARDPLITFESVTEIVNHGALHYTLGMRGFYLAVVFALWLFGPGWMFGGTVVLVLILKDLDRSA